VTNWWLATRWTANEVDTGRWRTYSAENEKREREAPATAAISGGRQAAVNGDGGDLRQQAGGGRRPSGDAAEERRRSRTRGKKKKIITHNGSGSVHRPVKLFSPPFLFSTRSKYIPGSTTGFAGILSKAGHWNI
jgi:hypothetical protein